MDIAPRIDWLLLYKTIDHFEFLGFKYVEVPWLVSKRAINATFEGNNSPVFQNKYVVGSGEQSFIQLEMNGDLPKGKYITLTPCFRDEPVVHQLKQLHFMKVELYVTDDLSDEYYAKLVHQCKEWFELCCPELYPPVEIVKTEMGHDINAYGIEVGSYGRRSFDCCGWIYATAMAEPRFTQARICRR